MHAYMILRGIKHDVDRFIQELSAQYLPTLVSSHRRPGGVEGGKPVEANVQVALRPIQIYELVYPKEHRDVVLNTVFGEEEGKTQHKRHNKYINMIRKILGIDKPTTYKKDRKIAVYGDNVEKVFIGEKDDGEFEDGTERL